MTAYELVEKAVTENKALPSRSQPARGSTGPPADGEAMLYPQVGVGTSFLRFRGSDSVMSLGGLDGEDGLFQVGFDAAWSVDLFGGTRRGVEAAKANEQATNAQRRGVVLLVAAETARAYLELRGTQSQLQIAETVLEEQRQTLAVTENKNRNGLASDLEVLRARTEVEATAARYRRSNNAIRQYINCSRRCGMEPTRSVGTGATKTVTAVPGQSPSASRPICCARRPDIQRAQSETGGVNRRRGVARPAVFPQIGSAAPPDCPAGNPAKCSTATRTTTPPARSIGTCSTAAFARRASSSAKRASMPPRRPTRTPSFGTFARSKSSIVAVDRAREQVSDLRGCRQRRESAAMRGATTSVASRPNHGARRPASIEPRRDGLLAQGEVQRRQQGHPIKALGGAAGKLPSRRPQLSRLSRANH